MKEFVWSAIDLVPADVAASGAPAPPYIDEDWQFDGDVTNFPPDPIVTVADRLQVGIVDTLGEVGR